MDLKYIGLLVFANLKWLASKLNSVVFELPYFSPLVFYSTFPSFLQGYEEHGYKRFSLILELITMNKTSLREVDIIVIWKTFLEIVLLPIKQDYF